MEKCVHRSVSLRENKSSVEQKWFDLASKRSDEKETKKLRKVSSMERMRLDG